MKVKFYSVSSQEVSKLPVVGGQLIHLSDRSGLLYDANGKRYSLQPSDEVLYNLFDSQEVNSSGVVGTINYTKDTGVLGDGLVLTDTEFSSIEFVLYDRGSGTQFSAFLHGIKRSDKNSYTYNWCNKACASLDTDSTNVVKDGNIYRETVYATVTVSADGTFNVTSKTHITETVKNGVITMTEKDVSEDNRVALIKAIGRR